MKARFVAASLTLTIVACAPVPEPESPPPVAPTKRTPQRDPFQKTPSNTPEIIWASVESSPATRPQSRATKW